MALTPFDPKNNPFDAFSQEDKDSIKEQLQTLQQNPGLNSAQHAGIKKTLRYLGVEPEPLNVFPQATSPIRDTLPRGSVFAKGDAAVRALALESFQRRQDTPHQRLRNQLAQQGQEVPAMQDVPAPVELLPADASLKKALENATPEVRKRLLEHPWVQRNLNDPVMRERAAGDQETMAFANPGTFLLGEAGAYGPGNAYEGFRTIGHGQFLKGSNEVIEGAFETLKPAITYGRIMHPIGTYSTLFMADVGSTIASQGAKDLGVGEEGQRLAGNIGAFAAGSATAGRAAFRRYYKGPLTLKLAEEFKARGVAPEEAMRLAEEQLLKYRGTGDPEALNAQPTPSSGDATLKLKANPKVIAKEQLRAGLVAGAAAASEPIKKQEQEPARGLTADVQGSPLPEVKRGTYLDKVQKAGTGTQASELAAHSLGKAAFGDGNYDVAKAPDGRFTVSKKEAVATTQQKVAEQTAAAVANTSATKPLATSSTQAAPKTRSLPERRVTGASAITPEVLNTLELEAATAEKFKQDRIRELEENLATALDPVERSVFSKELSDLKGGLTDLRVATGSTSEPVALPKTSPTVSPFKDSFERVVGRNFTVDQPELDQLFSHVEQHTTTPVSVLGIGNDRTAFDLGDKVVKMGYGPRPEIPNIPEVLQPLSHTHVKGPASEFRGGVHAEVYPKASFENVTAKDRAEMTRQLAAKGYTWDSAEGNLGRTADGKLVIVDGAGVTKIPEVPAKEPTGPSKTAQAKAEVRKRKAEQAGPLAERVSKLQEERVRLVARQERIGRNRSVNDREQAAIIRMEAQKRIENLRRHGASYDEVLRVQAEAKAKIKNLPKLDKPEVGEAEAKWLEKRIAEIDAALNGDDVSKGLRQQALEARAASQPMPELRKGRPTKAKPGAVAEKPAVKAAPAQPFNFMGPGAILPETRTLVREGGVVDSADLKPKSKGQSVEQAEAEVAALHNQDFGSFGDAFAHGTALFGDNFEVTLKDGRFKPVKKNSPQPAAVGDDAWKRANVNNPNWADEQLAELTGKKEPVTPTIPRQQELAPSNIATILRKGHENPKLEAGMVRLYRGEDSAGAGPEDANSGRWWSTDPVFAQSYGDRLWYMDVPQEMVSGDSQVLLENTSKYKARLLEPGYHDLGTTDAQKQAVFNAVEAGNFEEAARLLTSATKPLAVAPRPPVEAKAKINPDATYSSREQAEFAGEQLHGKGNFAIVESQSVTGKTQFRALKTGATVVAEAAKSEAAVPLAPVTEGETLKAKLPSGQVVEGKVEVVAATGYKIRTADGKAILVKPEWRVTSNAEPITAPEVVAQTKAISTVPAVEAAPAVEPIPAPKPAAPEKSFLIKKIEREIAYAEKQIEKAQAAGDMDKADAMAGGLAAKRARLEKIKNATKGNVAPAAVPAKETNVQKSVEAPATPRATEPAPAVKAKLSEKAQAALQLKADVVGEYPFTEPLVKEIETLLKADPAVSVDGKYSLFEKSLKALRDGLHNGDPRALERATEIAIRRNEAGFAGTAPRQFRFNSRMARAIANGHVEVLVRQWENMTDSELALRQVADTITSPNFEKQVELANDPNLAQRVADVRSRAGRASWEDPTDTLAKTFGEVTLTPKDLAMGAKREHLGENARQKEIMYRQLNKPVGYAESGLSKPSFAYEWAKNRMGIKSKLDGYISSWDHRPIEDMVAFIDRMENGDFQSMSPQDRAVGEKLREMLDTKRDEIYGLGEGYFENYLENYFPHIWTDPSKGAQLIHRVLGSKTPLGGPQGFLKGRTIEFFKEGLKPEYDSEGALVRPALTPVTYNPIQMALIRLHEMDRFLMAHRIKADLEAQGLTKFYRNDKEVPAGWTRLDDKTFRSYRPETKYELVDKENGLYRQAGTTGKFIENGGWYAPTGAAKVINNYLSPGLRGSKVFRGIRWYGNALNQAQLGLSAFHLTFTGLIDTPISTIALGTKQLLRGALQADVWSLKKGTENTLKGFSILPAIGESVFRGNRMLAEYMEPGQFAEYTRSVEALVEAGGRVRMDPYYRNNSVETVKRLGKEMSLAWRDPNLNAWAKGSKLGIKGTGAIINGAATVLEKAAVPVMEVVVPRMKLGLFYRLAEDVFHRVGPDAPHELIRAELGKAWDTVDNRMGQLVYDNLDWNKVAKDLAMISIRSVGWNYGTWREIGGGFKDTVVNTTKAVKSGNLRKVELTDRMTYLPAMVAYVGMLGAMTNFVNTGEMPKSTDDLFFPRTGNKNPDGTDERVEWASYMKDLYPLIVGSIKTGSNLGVYAGIKRAGVMLGHKIHPVIGQSVELAENQDYYGRELVHTGDNGFKQSWQILSHYLKGFEPLTFRNAAERKRSGASFGGQVGAGFGLVPAPKWLGQTPAQEYVFEMARRHMETGPKTADEFDKMQLMRQLEMQLDTKRITPSAVYQLAKEGKLSMDDVDKLFDDMTEDHDPLVRHFRRLSEEEALGGWERANKEEQAKLADLMDDKLNLAMEKLGGKEANEYFQRFNKARKK